MANACSIRVRGVVQGVGFRPFVYRLAHRKMLAGWVSNGEQGVEIHLEGAQLDLEDFVQEMRARPPAASSIAAIDVETVPVEGLSGFTIRESRRGERLTVRVSPDLPVCQDCLSELFDSSDRRYLYPYINCTNCGPRYSVILGLPYDRPNTTMKQWPLDQACSREYHDPCDRRFHAQPVACPQCGPNFSLRDGSGKTTVAQGEEAVRRAARLLNQGKILAVKGLGGYHLACDALNPSSNAALRERKYRKEKPFAVMARDLEAARSLVELSPDAEALMVSAARPIVIAPAKLSLPGVAPENRDLGVMLPYTPLHYMLFAEGAPEALVMTSANRSSEPIAYDDLDATERLSGIADGFLIGERSIARRVDDSVARAGVLGPVILRRARGYAPTAVALLPADRPILALGADLKNSITLVVDGQAFVSQHIGDLENFQSFRAFRETIHDLIGMYGVRWDELLVVHDRHPQYLSTSHASALPSKAVCAVQHHRAHLASVLAECGEWDKRVVGVSLDGTGFGDDSTIWGGEIFAGSVRQGFQRVAHLRSAVLAGGDAAAHAPVQAAAGFLVQIQDLPDLTSLPFQFGRRYKDALQLISRNVRSFPTTSVGRLFDAAAALLGFVRETSFEGQAAIWLEQLARSAAIQSTAIQEGYPFPFTGAELDFRPLLASVARDRYRRRPEPEIARAFQRGFAQGICRAVESVCHSWGLDTVVFSGGVLQNGLLLEDLQSLLAPLGTRIWINHAVPPNDGGISLGQATLAAFGQADATERPLHA